MTDAPGPPNGGQPGNPLGRSAGLPPELDPRRPVRGRTSTRTGAAGGSLPGARRSGRTRWGRALSWVAVVMSSVILLGSGAAYLAFNHFNGQITRLGGVTTRGDGNSTNYLLVGSDSRAGANGALGAGTTKDVGNARTDTMILVHFSPRAKKVTLVSFPRDSYVAIPGHGFNKLNAAYVFGGPALLVTTIQNLSGLHIDHFVQIDFNGFLAMTDAVGGVDICLSQPAFDNIGTGINLSAGKHHLNGIVALQYVRQRHGLPRGDIDRIQRQQTFIGAIIRKVLSAGTLLNPFRLTNFLDVATKAVEVDANLSINDMKNLALKLRHLDPAHVNFETIPIANQNGFRTGAGSVVLLDEAGMSAFFDKIKNDIEPGTPASTGGNPPPQLTVSPQVIHVQVLNGSGRGGQAATAANDLARLGFVNAGTGNADHNGYAHSVVRYGPTRSDSAKTLAAAVPGSVLQPDPNLGSSVVLVVGMDYKGVTAVTISAPTTTTTVPTAPTTAPVTAAQNPCGI